MPPDNPAMPTEVAKGAGRFGVAAGFGWGGLVLTTLLGLVSGISGALISAGLYALVVAMVALARGRVSWARLPTRAAGAVALVGAIVAVSVGGSLAPTVVPTAESTPAAAAPVPAASASLSTSPSVTTSATTTASPTTTDPIKAAIDDAEAGSALALVGALVVKGRGPMTGYSRDAFGAAWTDVDRNGCDQRNDTLRRDLRAVTLKPGTNGCAVMTGTLTDPYTGTIVPFTRTSSSNSSVEIDHVVALADAWVKGAAGWDQAKLTMFANDTANLVATSAKVNAAKGASDAATWLPPSKGYRCAYVGRQVAVKAKYHLFVTAAERTAMVSTLRTCAALRVPSVSVAKLGGFPLYQAPAPKPSPAPSAKPSKVSSPEPPSPPPPPAPPSPIRGVHPGAFCSPQGALGYTTKGTLMRCSTTTTDSRARWRAA